MPRTLTPLVASDLSTFTRTLRSAWLERHAAAAEPPSHVEMMNLVARAAGHRNVQALKAAQARVAALAPPAPAPPPAPATPDPALTEHARKALLQFDAEGRLQRWPVKYSVQRLVMWVLWTRFEARRAYSEREVNAILKPAQLFGDHVTLRRELINHRLLERKSDCSEYRKLPARADEETRALLKAWRTRTRAGSGARKPD